MMSWLGLSQSKMQDPRTLVGTFILFNLLVVSELKAVDALPALNTSSSTHDEESWDISTDNVAAYSIIPMLDLESLMKENANKESHPSRQKRSAKVKNIVFREVSSSQIRSLPYYGTVRISDICSGTMIGDSHVLTAAHCVHDGRNNFKLSKLRVGIPRDVGKFFWKKVSRIDVPKAWKTSKRNRNDINSLDADFAVLKLKHSHRQRYLKPQASKDRVRSSMKFNGYPGIKAGTMWHSSCSVEKVHQKKLLLSRCIVSKGSSGSGVYKSLGFGEYAVTGVVSAKVTIRKGRLSFSYAITNKLTAAKVKKICRWAERKDC